MQKESAFVKNNKLNEKKEIGMKTIRKLFVLCLFVGLAGVLAGCGASEDASNGENEANAQDNISDMASEMEEDINEDVEVEEEIIGWDFDAEPVTITVMSFFASDDLVVEQAVVDAFTEAYPNIIVEYENLSFSDYFTVLTTQIAGGDAPDVMAMNFENEARYADLGALEDLDPFIERDNLNLDKYFSSTVGMHRHSGIQAGLPATFSIVINFINKDLFDEAGLDYPDENWTWEDLLEAAQAMTKDVDGDGIIDQFGYVAGWWPNFVFQNGGQILNEEGRCGLNTSEAIEGLQIAVDITLDPEQKIAPNRDELSASGDWDRFEAGGIGILPMGPWAITPFKQDIQDNFDWDVAPMTSINQPATFMFGNSYAMSSSSEEKDAAWEFIKFATGEEGSEIRQAGEYEISPVKTIAANGFLPSLNGYPENAQYFLDATSYAILPVAHPLWNEMHDIIWPELEQALLGEQSVEEAVAIACEGVDALLEDNGY